MDKYLVTLSDDKGTIKLYVSKETAERLATDNQYATKIAEQVRAAGHSQATQQPDSATSHPQVQSQPPVTHTRCPTPIPQSQPSTSHPQVQSQPPVTHTRCPTPIPQSQPSTSHPQVQSQPPVTHTRCPTPIPQSQPSTSHPQVQSQPPVTHTRCPTPPAKTGPQQSTSSDQSPPSHQEVPESQTEFRHTTTLLLLEQTRTYIHLYHRNKIAFYKKLEQAFTSKGYTFTNEKIRKKLGNILTTYKRAKDRSRTTGEGKITWEYYSQMDEIFGGSGVGSAPPGTTVSTPLFPSETTTGEQTEEQPGPSTAVPSTARPATRRKGSTQPPFFNTYQAHAERRTVALESLVRPEMARFRRLKEKRRRTFEKKMLSSMGQILTQLKEMGKKQDQIIELLKDSNKK